MVVGLLRITLHIPEAQSLKDRRSAVRRAVERVRARFNVAIAEVGDPSRWQLATLAVAAVSNDRAHVNEILDKVTGTIANAGAALVTQREMDIQSYSDREPLGEGAFDSGPLAAREPRPTTIVNEADDEDDDGDYEW